MINKSTSIFALIAAIMGITGCAGSSKYMNPVNETTESLTPSDEQASVVFMRPSRLGYAINSAVFDVTENENKLVGIVPAKKKVVYKTNPGEHMFMVTSEAGDFMKANLEKGKVYFALVTPRMGAWKARFSLRAINKSELSSSEFQDWLKDCELIEVGPATFDWAKENAESIESKRVEYLPKWNSKSEEDKPYLKAEDGR